LVVLAFDLKLGLKFFYLQIETRDFSAELSYVGADGARLRWCRRYVLKGGSVLVRVSESRMGRLLRICGMCWRRRRLLETLCRGIRE
jgi:hypothetical protein